MMRSRLCLFLLLAVVATPGPRSAVCAFGNERALSVERFRNAFDDLGLGGSPILAGFATSMEKILPRDVPFELTVAKSHRDGACPKRDRELPDRRHAPRRRTAEGGRDDRGSEVRRGRACSRAEQHRLRRGGVRRDQDAGRPTRSRTWAGGPIRSWTSWARSTSPRATCRRSGFACGRQRTSRPASIAARFASPPKASQPLAFGLTVRVYRFTLPDHTPLPTAITFFERKPQMGGEQNWQRDEIRTTPTSWRTTTSTTTASTARDSPDFEIIQQAARPGPAGGLQPGQRLQRGHQRGRLRRRPLPKPSSGFGPPTKRQSGSACWTTPTSTASTNAPRISSCCWRDRPRPCDGRSPKCC